VLFATVVFCHGLIRVCMLVVKRPRGGEGGDDLDSRPPWDPERAMFEHGGPRQMFGPGGYAMPRRPIRVVMARDEEAAGLESETVTIKPPAYGAWRESVVRIESISYQPAAGRGGSYPPRAWL
jgi:hypothetical protein